MSSQSKTVNLKLYFPDANGGPNVGPSDAGAQFFAGNLMANLAPECAKMQSTPARAIKTRLN